MVTLMIKYLLCALVFIAYGSIGWTASTETDKQLVEHHSTDGEGHTSKVSSGSLSSKTRKLTESPSIDGGKNGGKNKTDEDGALPKLNSMLKATNKDLEMSKYSASYAPLISQLMPAVVSITATKKQKDNGIKHGPPNLFSFRDFRDLMENLQPFFDNRQQPANRNVFLFGSGFIIDKDGLIVTNNHVIENSDEVIVKFNDDTTAKAKVLGRDQYTDIALLKVDIGKALPYVKFGDSDAVQIGDRVLAIGSPIGLGGSVSSGIISARSRDIRSGPYDDFLQTDASLNQGSSGSPLFNLFGEVVGINTAIYSTSGGGNIGIGFAIPSNAAIYIIDRLKKDSRVRRGYLGVTVQEVTPDIAQAIGKDDLKGVLVNSVVKSGPADLAGLKVGDVVVEFNGKTISRIKEFSRSVAYFPIENPASIKILRKNVPVTLQIQVGELKIDQSSIGDTDQPREKEEKTGGVDLVGMTVMNISPELRQAYGLNADVVGVVVISVNNQSDAEKRGIRSDDIIDQVGQTNVANVNDFKSGIDAAVKKKQKFVLLRVIRGGQPPMFVPIDLGKG